MTAEVWRKKSDNAQVYGFFYDYDGANNRLKLRREFGTGTEWDSAYFAYAADNSLTQRRKQTPPSTFLSTYYSYDANGALIKEWTPGGGGGWGNQAWGSSPYGGGTGDDVVYYEYGPQQLVTRIIPTSEAPTQFFYDGRLNRYLINQAGTPTYYLWDGLNQLEERNADGSLKARYTHGNYRQYGIGSVVEVERVANSTTYFQYLHMDHRGTAYAVTDASQSTQLSYTQDAFGTQLAATGGANPNVPNNLIYQSNWLTLQIGGRNYGVSRYRLYDPDLGTFLSRDFLPFLNKYRAWSNNPSGQVDRNGLADAFEGASGSAGGLVKGIEEATKETPTDTSGPFDTMQEVLDGRKKHEAKIAALIQAWNKSKKSKDYSRWIDANHEYGAFWAKYGPLIGAWEEIEKQPCKEDCDCWFKSVKVEAEHGGLFAITGHLQVWIARVPKGTKPAKTGTAAIGRAQGGVFREEPAGSAKGLAYMGSTGWIKFDCDRIKVFFDYLAKTRERNIGGYNLTHSSCATLGHEAANCLLGAGNKEDWREGDITKGYRADYPKDTIVEIDDYCTKNKVNSYFEK